MPEQIKRKKLSFKASHAKGKNYEDVADAFRTAGFVNVEFEVKYDIVTGWINDDGEVASVKIGDTTRFSEDASFRPDEQVIITYHTLKKNKPE